MSVEMRKYMDIVENASASDEFWLALTRYLIGGLQPFNANDPKTREVMAALDREMPKLESSFTVWRGIQLAKWDDLRPETDFRNKKQIAMPGYVSASKSFESARLWMEESWSDTGRNMDEPEVYIMFEITTMAGAGGIDVNEHLDELNAVIEKHGDEFYGMGIFTNEQEVILGRNAVFDVLGVEEKSTEWAEKYHSVKLGQTG